MNDLEKKIAETLGALMLENRKLQMMLEASVKEIDHLKSVIAEMAKKQSANGHDAEDAMVSP